MASKRRQFTTTSTAILTSTPSSLPTLLFDVVVEILCRMPVKLLLQLQCLGNSFNSLISDPKFAKKHLHFSPKRHHLMVGSTNDYMNYFSLILQFPLFFQLLGLLWHISVTLFPNPLSACGLCTCALAMASFVSPSIVGLLFCGSLPLENSGYCLLLKIHKEELFGLL